MAPSRVIIEADGGARGNPGPAAYGALIRDADTGEVIAERAEHIGVATNNVAEYRGLIAGLELVREHTPDAGVEARMDSKLVVEQMAGRWKIKNAGLRPLALQARAMAPVDVTWTWVPRAENGAADALVNRCLDDGPGSRIDTAGSGTQTEPAPPTPVVQPLVGWRPPAAGTPTALILLRHGVTAHTVGKMFSGSSGADPKLNAEGKAQATRAADWLRRWRSLATDAQLNDTIAAVHSSPLRRCRETAEIVGKRLGISIGVDDDLVETDFGEWDGRTYPEVQERWPDEFTAWIGSTAVAPPGGEPIDRVAERAGGALHRLIDKYPGQTVVVVSHVTPMKMILRETLQAPMDVIHHLHVAPASLSIVAWWPDGVSAVKLFSYTPI
ncbi:MAG TPA: bifunctional RNase H/acid phosphatase [Nocardioidaceae bacterium]|nr:bifunctional RNase H/acid phosphatase [Nocardioidaceae bacterium]